MAGRQECSAGGIGFDYIGGEVLEMGGFEFLVITAAFVLKTATSNSVDQFGRPVIEFVITDRGDRHVHGIQSFNGGSVVKHPGEQGRRAHQIARSDHDGVGVFASRVAQVRSQVLDSSGRDLVHAAVRAGGRFEASVQIIDCQ
jgi:hypothetical protein